MKKIFSLVICLFGCLCLFSCSKGMGNVSSKPEYNGDAFVEGGVYAPSYEEGSESYLEIIEGGFISPLNKPTSSFSLDSSSYAYSNLRRLIMNNNIISKDAVNIEQMLNYFNYSYKNDGENALDSSVEIAECPWNSNNYLALISVNSKDIEIAESNNNFVFLIDVSGSMNSENKLGLFKESFNLFMENISDDDTVSIVTYASGVRVIADGIKGDKKGELLDAVDMLSAGGSTNGSGGIQAAYELASKHFINGGNNRVLIATDGDFNVGISDRNELNEFISEKRNTGVYLSIFGYGVGNSKHDIMETLANNGNGNAYYIDSILEAKRVFVSELGSVLNTVAKDSKIQVEFNPNMVNKYRLIGFENKTMTDEEFKDNTTDAGEIGAGHSVIAMYEIELTDENIQEYILRTRLRYKDVSNGDADVEVCKVVYNMNIPSDDFMFACSVVEFGLILRDSDFKGDSSFEHLIEYLSEVELDDVYKEEFRDLVNLAYTNHLLNK